MRLREVDELLNRGDNLGTFVSVKLSLSYTIPYLLSCQRFILSLLLLLLHNMQKPQGH